MNKEIQMAVNRYVGNMARKRNLRDSLRWLRDSRKLLDVVIAVLVFGSIWGLLEATLGGFLHLIHFTHKGAIMGGVGMAIMAAFVVTRRHPGLLIGVGCTAALFKLLSPVVYGQPLLAPFVVNPAVAIILESLAFSLVVSLLYSRFERNVRMRVAAGIAAGYLSITFYAIFASVAGRGYWPLLSFTEKVKEVFVNGTGIAIVGTILLLVGYALAVHLRPKFVDFKSMKPKTFYAGAGATAICCWVFALVAFDAGL